MQKGNPEDDRRSLSPSINMLYSRNKEGIITLKSSSIKKAAGNFKTIDPRHANSSLDSY